MDINGPVIIVDDDDDDHYVLNRVFEKIGFSKPVRFFTEAIQVLDYLRETEEKPFLILSDVNMPVMNGLDLKKQIDADPILKKKGIPFIFFSTSAMAPLVREAFELSAQGFFLKGQNLEDLEKTLRIIFDYWEKCEHPKSK